MDTQFIRAEFDLHCTWEDMPPSYRVFVNDELFAERTWNLTGGLSQTQILQLQLSPGKYHVRVEDLPPNLASFHSENYQIKHGRARWRYNDVLQSHTIEVYQ